MPKISITLIALLIVTAVSAVTIGTLATTHNPSSLLSSVVSPFERLLDTFHRGTAGENSVAQTSSVALQTNIPAGHRGYYPRACGFDMDDDFIYGEPEDCNVCDGVTTNIDNDVAVEQQIYVDCQDGSDTTGTGSASSPYKTFSRAMTVAGGHADDSTESIICGRGTCSPTHGSTVQGLDIIENGAVDGVWYKEKQPTGSEEYAYRYPKNPFMIVGWDTDNDGCYPPFDDGSAAAQAAGCGAAQSKPLILDACPTSGCSSTVPAKNTGFTPLTAKNYIEIAHMTGQNYGSWTGASTAPTGFINYNGASATDRNGMYIHDIVVKNSNINKVGLTSTSGDGSNIVGIRLAGSRTNYMSLENIFMDTYSSWPLRGFQLGDYFRLKNWEMKTNIPLRNSSGGYLQMPLLRVWSGDNKHIELLDSKGDSNYNYDVNQPYNPGGFGISTTGHQVFRNIETKNNMGVQSSCRTDTGNGDCDVIFDKIYFTVDKELPTVIHAAIDVGAGSANGEERGNMCVNNVCQNDSGTSCSGSDNSNCVGGNTANQRTCATNANFTDISITNSVIAVKNSANISSAIQIPTGSNCPGSNFGTVTISNNTFTGNYTKQNGVINIGPDSDWGNRFDWKYVHQNYVLTNNIFHGMSADKILYVNRIGQHNYAPLAGRTPSNFVAKNNIYSTDSPSFTWGASTPSTYTSWANASGETNMVTNCVPTFTADGFHLASQSCPINIGDNATCTDDDIDSGARAKTAGDKCDIGADEYGGSVVQPPTYACSDGRDNDVPADGFIDYPADPGCTSTTDNDEYNVPVTSTTTCDTTYPSNTFRVCYFDGISAPTTAVTTLATAIETTVPSPVGTWSGFSKSWGTGVITPTTKSDSISAVWRGRINFSAGTYTFTTQSDDGVELTIQNVNGGAPIISNWTTHANTTDTSAPITLAAGQYNVQLRYHENTGSANIGLSWTKTTPPVTGAQCGNGIDDEDTEDTLIDMNDPGCGISTDTDESNPTPISRFSNGTRVAVSTSVANIRPYAGDNTSPSPQQPQGALGTVTAGPKWGILNGNGFWYWQVNFDSGTDGWAGDNNLTAAPVVTLPACQDGTDNDGDGLIDSADYGCVTDTDTDEANPSPSTKFTAGTNIVVSGIEGTNVRAYAGGPVVSGVGQPSGATGTVVGGPKYAIFNGTGIWWWQIDYTNAPDGWSGEPLLSAVVAPTYACSNGRDDDSDGKTDAQDVGCINDTDTSESNPTPVTTKFTVGANITVSGTGGVNVREYPGGPTAGTGQAYQATGRVVAGPKYATLNGNPVWWWQIDYTSGTDGWSGENLLSLAAVSSNTCNTAFPTDKFHVCYFDGITAPTTAATVLAQTDETTVPSPVGTWTGFSKSWGTGVVTPTEKSDSVSAVWRGRINFSAGTYTFTTQSDDGVELIIQGVNGGQPLISNWTIHSNTTNTSQPITLAAGQYNVQLRYYENLQHANIGLSWTKQTTQAPAACADGTDNDGDGKTDYGTGTNNDPGCTSTTDNDEYNAPINNAVSCSPSSQSTYTNASASFTATGGNGTFSWSATGGSPSTGSGASFSTTYSSTGTKTVTVTSNGMSDSCSVSVSTTPPIQPTSTDQGYQSRACSFDLDFDGVRGEAEDCNEICRAPVDSSGNVTVSVETYREEIYVDTVNGVDGTSCGLNGKRPCKTIARAWNDIAANGSSAKADVVCFAGTERNLSDYAPKSNGLATVNGVAATYTVPKRGNEVRDFKYAKYPTMLVGWDKDRDGKYPPNDTDDVAVIDGAGKPIAFDLMVNKNQYIELAHFKAVNFGQNYDTGNDTGVIKGFAVMNENGTDATRYSCSYRSIHDIELENINSRIETHDSRRVFSYMGSCPIQYTAIENIQCKYCGGWFMRGGWGQDIEGITKGPLRLKNMTLRILASTGGSNTRGGSLGIKFWGSKNVEILDNILDGGTIASPGFSETWTPQSDSTLTGIFASGGSENWDVINNKILNFKTGFNVASYHIQETYKGHGDKVNISRNQVINNYAGTANDFNCIRQTVAVGETQNNYGDPNVLDIKEDPPHNQGTNNGYMGDITFHSNVCYSPTMSSCIFDAIGNINNDIPNDPGTNRYLNNVCRAPGGTQYGFVMLGFPWGAGTPEHYQTRYVIKNNIFSSDVGSNAIRISPELAPKLSLFDVNNNVYAIGSGNTGARFIWGNNSSTDLAGWRNTTHRPDTNAQQCEPSFQSQTNFHLQSSDTCAMNSGVAYTNFTPMYDMDGQLYGTDGRVDIGADEYR